MKPTWTFSSFLFTFILKLALSQIDIFDQIESVTANLSIRPRFPLGNTILDPLLEEARAAAVREIDRRRESTSDQGQDTICDPFLLSPTRFESSSADQVELALEISKQLSRLRDRIGITRDQFLHALPSINISTVFPKCIEDHRRRSCLPLPISLATGECNNVENPLWGASGQSITPLLDSSYADDAGEIRTIGLPTAIDVSRAMHRTSSSNLRPTASGVSMLLPAWMHFIQQDILQLATMRGTHGACPLQLKSSDCCPLQNPNCVSMTGETSIEGDPLRKIASPLCSDRYVRLAPSMQPDCTLGPRVPVNLASAYIDGSHIYGTDRRSRLREFRDGLMKLSDDLLPPSSEKIGQRCLGKQACFDFGSFQSNFHPYTSALHTLILFHHNHMATELKKLNPRWSDDRLFQESRKIIVAKLQVITYREFLPLLIGREMMERFGLSVDDALRNGQYRRNVQAQVSDGYAAAAANLHYAMWPDTIDVGDRSISLRDALFNTDHLRRDDSLITAATSGRPIRSQRLFSSHLTNLTISMSRKIDIAATVIQMGRDIGVQPYVQWRRLCKLPVPETFDQLLADMEPSTVELLRSIYRSVHDIDLFTGAISERSVHGGLVGPTLACLVADQFQRLKLGDRFWYQNRLPPSAGFSSDQLTEISSTTLARLLCEESEIGKVQPWALMAPDQFENQPVDCSNPAIPKFDISKWKEAEPKATLPLSPDMLKKALELGRRMAVEKRKTEQSNAVHPNVRSKAAFFHYMIFRPDEFTRVIGQASEVLLETTRLLTEKKSIFGDHVPEFLTAHSWQALLPSIDVSAFLAELPDSRCLPRPSPCDESSRYRTISGWCNNLNNPAFGVSHTAFRRLLPPAYDDGFNEPRQTAKSGKPLPGPRTISLSVHSTIVRDHSKYTLLLMQWGQFVDHDITLTPMESSISDNGPILDCSACNSRQTVSQNCWPVPIPDDDPIFGPAPTPGGLCLPFVRSQLGQLRLGYRNQLNQFSSYIDISHMYGSDECRASLMRGTSPQGGRLEAQLSREGEELPAVEHGDVGCRTDKARPCFSTGDSRVNENPAVGGMHTVFLREHNAIADRLAALNPQWDDEKLFQETRRIVIAVAQHITYKEFLPKVVGWRTMAEFNLTLRHQRFYDGYDSSCDATVSNEFATAAFRFGHSLVPSTYSILDSKYRKVHSFNLTDLFFNPRGLYQARFCDKLMMGLATEPMQGFDRFVSSSLRDQLFATPDDPKSGLDLVSLNIQRGRDHGLPPYTKFREHFQLSVPSRFEDLLHWMDNATVVALRKVYESVHDIDLFTGMLSERPLPGALVGPLAAKMIGEQFQRLRKCDRFWYENSNYPGAFGKDQLAEIRHQSLAHVLCRTLPSIETIQPQVFDQVNDLSNARIPCNKLRPLDLTLWAERSQCQIGGTTIAVGRSLRISPCTSCMCNSNGKTKCASSRVKNCLRLLQTEDRTAVMSDTSCVVQCFAFIKLLEPH